MAMIHDSEHPDGVRDDGSAVASNGPSDDLINARQRKGIAVAEFYIRTRSWERAAEFGGYPTARAARVAAEKALNVEFKTTSRSQEYMRKYMVMHLEMMMGSLAVKAADQNHPEHIAAIKALRELLGDEAKLLGLNAPTRLSLVDPTEDQIQAWLDEKVGPRHSDEEADIFDVDVIEDTPRELEA